MLKHKTLMFFQKTFLMKYQHIIIKLISNKLGDLVNSANLKIFAFINGCSKLIIFQLLTFIGINLLFTPLNHELYLEKLLVIKVILNVK